MDGPPYSSNVINNHHHASASYPSSTSSTPHNIHQQPSVPPQTLPPLQHGHAVMQSTYNNYAQSPRTPATPNTPGSNNNMGSYPPPPNNGAGRGSYPMMTNNPYGNHVSQPYPATSAMMPQASTALSHPQPIAPAPSPGARGPPVLRPMPTGGVMPQPGMNSPYGHQNMVMTHPPMMGEGEQPTHVVGSQGRRGVLPSAPGRPAPSPATLTKNLVMQKDADGKFPCPHCTKTYLHAKHLKRHLLRHTGDRPYMCVLCRDTFSRSDILKRHFQKCSIRRGNPTGASHLSHPQAHVKKHAAAQKALEGDLSQMNGMGNMPGAPENSVPMGFMPMPGADGMSNDQTQLSRSGSMQRLEDANDRDRRGVAGRGGNFEQPYNGNANPNMNPQLTSYPMPPGQNGMPYAGQGHGNIQSNLDWASMFPPNGAQQSYVNAFPPNVGQTQIAPKRDPNPDAVRTAADSGDSHNELDLDPPFFINSNWGEHDRSYQLSTLILNFLSPPEYASSRLTAYFTPDNVVDFLSKYIHFNCHFPMLHIPTFRVLETYTGLLATLCCVGACYSERVSPDDVREMMTFLKTALERDSPMLRSMIDGSDVRERYSTGLFELRNLEELQAVILLHALLVWNGTREQRESARRIAPAMSAMARLMGLLEVSQDARLYSYLHQPDVATHFRAADFDWRVWVEQEKRIRLMYILYLCDVALGLFFNHPPQFDAFEIRLPLPADDAVWDALNEEQCLEALGLRGLQPALRRNADGTLRLKQPEMHLTLRALLHTSYSIQTGVTNLYGKFILIHGILALMRKTQVDGHHISTHGSSTPLGQQDWITASGQDLGSGVASGHNSGRATPVDGAISPQTLKSFVTALDKFKKNWDMDMAAQFPPSSNNPRRQGYSRDGVHYYWLANWMLKNTRSADLQMSSDQRFTHVIHLLKSVKSWVMTDGASRGEELGSVGEIEDDYGAKDLTLNMVSLFRPLHRVVESPGIASGQTDIGI